MIAEIIYIYYYIISDIGSAKCKKTLNWRCSPYIAVRCAVYAMGYTV